MWRALTTMLSLARTDSEEPGRRLPCAAAWLRLAVAVLTRFAPPSICIGVLREPTTITRAGRGLSGPRVGGVLVRVPRPVSGTRARPISVSSPRGGCRRPAWCVGSGALRWAAAWSRCGLVGRPWLGAVGRLPGLPSGERNAWHRRDCQYGDREAQPEGAGRLRGTRPGHRSEPPDR